MMNKRKNTVKMTASSVLRKLEKQRFKCYYCDCNITSINISREHKKPYSTLWNINLRNNIVFACKLCNKLKWDISEELFREWYICVNYKPWFDLQSYNKEEKVRWKKRWYHWNLIKWNNRKYTLVRKLYE